MVWESEMLSKFNVMPTIPASDMERAKDFYSTKLGLQALATNKAAWFKDSEGNILALDQMG
jgi:catechol 2,3-dioxygenase-like lactoylglutathione lyase family enzyme